MAEGKDENPLGCDHARLLTPVRGVMCDLTTWTGETDFSKGKTCREMCGSEECRKHAYRTTRTTIYKAEPIYPAEFVDHIRDYVEVER